MKIKLLTPYGFCAGVELVLEKIEQIIQENEGKKIYCIGQLVHNNEVNRNLTNKGIEILEGEKKQLINQIDEGVVVFSAHGTDPAIIKAANDKGLKVYDCTCPFVKKTFDLIRQKNKEGYCILYVGVKGHAEAEAALSLVQNSILIENEEDVKRLKIKKEKYFIINQTTLSIDNLDKIYTFAKKKIKNLCVANEICNSTRKRQNVLKTNLLNVDGVVVVGDGHSNNTNTLLKLARDKGVDSIMIDSYDKIDSTWFTDKTNIIVCSGSSTSKENVEKIYNFLKNFNKN